MSKTFKEIQDKYTDIKEPGSFASLQTFKKNHPEYKGYNITEALKEVESFERHRPVNKKFQKVKTNLDGIDKTWQIDLIDLSSLNNKAISQAFNFIFVCIDVFSKFLWACPISNKESSKTAECYKNIIDKSGRKPKAVYHDEGTEFKGYFKEYLQKHQIAQYLSSIRYKYKASTVERVNKTIKEKIWRYFTYTKKKNYIEILDKLVDSYNNTLHSSLVFGKKKYTPQQISSNLKLAEKIEETKRKEHLLSTFYNPIHFDLSKGDYVRTSVIKETFQKGYLPNWTEEIYCISTLVPSVPPRYKITTIEENTEPVELNYCYYKEELRKVSDNEFPIDIFIVSELDKENLLVSKLNDKNQDKEVIISKKEFKETIGTSEKFEEIKGDAEDGEEIKTAPKKRGRKTREEKALLRASEYEKPQEEGVKTRSRAKAENTQS